MPPLSLLANSILFRVHVTDNRVDEAIPALRSTLRYWFFLWLDLFLLLNNAIGLINPISRHLNHRRPPLRVALLLSKCEQKLRLRVDLR